jgi:hypothetical protein
MCDTMEEKTLNKEEEAIMNAMRENPELQKCILEMIEITHEGIKDLNKGDDAEEAVVNAVRKTGKVLLQEWADKKAKEAENSAQQDNRLRRHEKKSKLANIIR